MVLRVILLCCLAILTVGLRETIFPEQNPQASTLISQDVSVPIIARQVTVRIFNDQLVGSGVVVERRGKIYTVLTCAHVVAESPNNRYSILTPDGKTYNGRLLSSKQFGNTDLALVQFNSDRIYQVASIADHQTLTIGDTVYAAGFPNWHWSNSNTVDSTHDWGGKAFQLTQGKVAMLPEKSLQDGYQIGYTNEIEQGMSGGPVLDRYGRLIGINGRLKYPLQGINAFIFADGTAPSNELFNQMESLSWAVPITKFHKAL
ncbi:MAG: serine protease [Phormidium sp.]